MDVQSPKMTEKGNGEELTCEVFGVKPELFLNELFNTVHCATADVMESFGDFLMLMASSNGERKCDIEGVLAGVDGLHEKLMDQIEHNMSIFCDIALTTCFAMPLGILKEVQMRRSLPPVNSTGPASNSTNEPQLKSDIQTLLKESRMCRHRRRLCERRLEELKKQRTSLQQEFSTLTELESSHRESMCQLRNTEERVRVMERLLCEGQKLLDVYNIKLGTASMSTEQKAAQIEKNIRYWDKIVGGVDLEAAMKAWPF